jgi:hypothetical protein
MTDTQKIRLGGARVSPQNLFQPMGRSTITRGTDGPEDRRVSCCQRQLVMRTRPRAAIQRELRELLHEGAPVLAYFIRR